MKILCNLPLESFEAREHYQNVEVVSFGPSDRMWVDGTFYPFDVEFDPSQGTIQQLFRRLPQDFRPDVLLIYWPDQEPLPAGMEHCPCQVVGVLSDYNLTLPFVAGLWPFFDVLLVDRAGVDLFKALSFPDVRYFCQFTFKASTHKIYPGTQREIDLAFAGNLNPTVQRERTPWIKRLSDLSQSGLRTEVRSGIFGEDYGRFLSAAKIGFNRSIRGEMNLRAFEVPACGALLFMEEENLEVRDFLAPDEEVVLYKDGNFEALALDYAGNDRLRQQMARAGHERIQEYRMGRRLEQLARLLQEKGPGRPQASAFDRALGRGVAMLSTWARGDSAAGPLLAASRLCPDDPRPQNALAVARLQQDEQANLAEALRLLKRACSVSPSYVPAALNLSTLLARIGEEDVAAELQSTARARLAGQPGWTDLDGPLLPIGFNEQNVQHSLKLAEAVRTNDASLLSACLDPS